MPAGLYRLEHVPTGRFYIGASMRWHARRWSWFNALRRMCDGVGAERGSAKLRRFAEHTAIGDWRFQLVRQCDGLGREELLEAEVELLRQALKDPRCLNTDLRRKGGSMPTTFRSGDRSPYEEFGDPFAGWKKPG